MISCLPTIAKAVQQIRGGELTAVELVEFCLARIERYEETIQAWELVDREGARAEAARLDQEARQGNLVGSLHGMPIGIKDIIDVAGWPTKAGSKTRTDHIAGTDATLVQRLRAAGAIILGKTVTTEFACFDPARTRNPWNPRHSPGGSSSGSAAAVAAQMCMAAIGTQTGGSIIRPSSYCGVCGLKPTLDQVPLDGVVPISPRLDHGGPIARSVRDAARVFFALASTDALEQMWSHRSGQIELAPEIEDELEGVTANALDWILFEHPETARWPCKLVPLTGFFAAEASNDVRTNFQQALGRLADWLVADTAARNPFPVNPPFELSTGQPMEGIASFQGLHERHRRIMAVDAAEFHRKIYARQPEDFGDQMRTLIESGLSESRSAYDDAVAGQAAFRDEMYEWLGHDKLAVTPATTTVAPTMETTGDPAFNSPWSYAGWPAITVPCGVSASGLPCGFQIVGPPQSELRVLRAASYCEQAFAFSYEDLFGKLQ